MRQDVSNRIVLEPGTECARGVRRFGGVGRAHAGLALLLASVIAGSGCGHDEPPRPSLVLITIDRLAADRLACFGGPPDAGAALCELARPGTLFGWAMTPVPDEAPAAASVLTGLPPEVHGVDHRGIRFLSETTETLAERLARAGYATGAFVASRRLNASRRLDQGFERYVVLDPPDAGRAGHATLLRADAGQADAVQSWLETVEAPYFLWIHTRSDGGPDAVDRLVDRLARVLERGDPRPGVVFAALAGEPEAIAHAPAVPGPNPRIELRRHRVPLLWRPPYPPLEVTPSAMPAVSWSLASLLDVAPTLYAAAGITAASPNARSTPTRPGIDLDALARSTGATAPAAAATEATGGATEASGSPGGERFLLLRAGGSGDEIGLASAKHLYVRRPSPLDGTGRAVPTSELSALAPRFIIQPPAPGGDSHTHTGVHAGAHAALGRSTWRTEVLRAESPVPRLEFHLSRLLAEAGAPGPRTDPESR